MIFIRSQSTGFSLIECVVSLGLLSTLLPLMVNVIINYNLFITHLEEKALFFDEKLYLEQLIRHDLRQAQSITQVNHDLHLIFTDTTLYYRLKNHYLTRQYPSGYTRYLSKKINVYHIHYDSPSECLTLAGDFDSAMKVCH